MVTRSYVIRRVRGLRVMRIGRRVTARILRVGRTRTRLMIVDSRVIRLLVDVIALVNRMLRFENRMKRNCRSRITW